MTTMTTAAYLFFNDLMDQWRREGKRIGWEELQAAYRLAMEVDGREREKDDGTHSTA